MLQCSGVLLGPGVTSWLQLQYAARRVTKRYWALVAAGAEVLGVGAEGLIEPRRMVMVMVATCQ
jgi:hypothetical protein